jgi:NAD(P)-dependent dehydrogenase (short-subunit alcohol dehydrogenase family)
MKIMNGGVAVVTGGASGLGKAMAEEAARRGMKVVIADVEAGAMEQAVTDLRADRRDQRGVGRSPGGYH